MDFFRKSMDFLDFLWVFNVFFLHGFLWVFLGFLWFSMGVHVLLWISVVLYGISWYGTLWISMALLLMMMMMVMMMIQTPTIKHTEEPLGFCPGHHLGGMGGGELFDNDRGVRLVPCFTWRLDSQNHPRAQNLMFPIKNGNFCVYHAANFQTNSCHVDMRPVSKAPTSSLRVPACTKSVSVDLCSLADVRKSVWICFACMCIHCMHIRAYIQYIERYFIYVDTWWLIPLTK